MTNEVTVDKGSPRGVSISFNCAFCGTERTMMQSRYNRLIHKLCSNECRKELAKETRKNRIKKVKLNNEAGLSDEDKIIIADITEDMLMKMPTPCEVGDRTLVEYVKTKHDKTKQCRHFAECAEERKACSDYWNYTCTESDDRKMPWSPRIPSTGIYNKLYSPETYGGQFFLADKKHLIKA